MEEEEKKSLGKNPRMPTLRDRFQGAVGAVGAVSAFAVHVPPDVRTLSPANQQHSRQLDPLRDSHAGKVPPKWVPYDQRERGSTGSSIEVEAQETRGLGLRSPRAGGGSASGGRSSTPGRSNSRESLSVAGGDGSGSREKMPPPRLPSNGWRSSIRSDGSGRGSEHGGDDNPLGSGRQLGRPSAAGAVLRVAARQRPPDLSDLVGPAAGAADPPALPVVPARAPRAAASARQLPSRALPSPAAPRAAVAAAAAGGEARTSEPLPPRRAPRAGGGVDPLTGARSSTPPRLPLPPRASA